MSRASLPSVVVALVACGNATPSPARHRPCVALAVAQAQVEESQRHNRGNLLHEIEARGLTLVTLPGKAGPVGEMSNEWRTEKSPSGVTLLLAPVAEQGCGALATDVELVQKGNEVWALVPAPSGSVQRQVETCACMSEQPARCGGAAPRPVQLEYELPAGVEFKGPMPILYSVEAVGIAYADQHDHSGCPGDAAAAAVITRRSAA